MATIKIVCRGESWQQDWPEIFTHAVRFYWSCFKDEEQATEAAHMMMEVFIKKWGKGQELTLSLNYVARQIRAGRTFTAKRRNPRIRLYSGHRNFHQKVKAKDERMALRMDVREAIERLPWIDRKVCRLLLEGYTPAEAARKCEIAYWVADRAKKRLASLMQD